MALVNSIFDRMETKLKDIEQKNMEKTENPEGLKEAIALAIEEVRKGREKCVQELEPLAKQVEEGSMSKEEFVERATECIKSVIDAAKQYLGKDRTGVKTAKATFSRCANSYMKRTWKKLLESQ